MADPRPSPRLALALLALLALLAARAPASVAADHGPPLPVSDNVLDRPIVDVAWIPRADGPGDLITLSTDGAPPGGALLSVLRRERAWTVVAEETIQVGVSSNGAFAPWLVELGEGRYAVIAVEPDAGRTHIVAVSVAGEAEIERPVIGGAVTLDHLVTGAGAADIDGDGRDELVVAGPAVLTPGALCQDSIVQVLDHGVFPRAVYLIPDLSVTSGAIGEWDGQPGDDLLLSVSTYTLCPGGSTSVQQIGHLALRLANGATIADLPRTDVAGLGSGPPLPIDIDRDGRDEALIADGPRLAIVDPARDWAMTPLGPSGSIALFAGHAGGPKVPGGLLAWFEPTAGPGVGRVMLAGVTRSAEGGIVAASPVPVELVDDRQGRATLARAGIEDTAARQLPAQLWRGDIDGDGCPDILAPLLTAECDGQGSLRAGALWLATRPLAVYDAGPNRELLVAGTMEWDPTFGRIVVPTPAAAATPGAWRQGPSVRFVLSELRAADAIYFTTYPVPKPTIERIAFREQATDVPGFTGSRVLVRAITALIEDGRPPVPPPIASFLDSETRAGESVTISRIAVPSGGESGRDGSFVRVPLPDILSGDVGEVEGWSVTITQLNDWGEIAPPVAASVSRDSTGPSLTVEVPFLTPPWPWEATLRGRTETGASVRIGDGPVADTDRLGRFVVTTQLAPWPQTVLVTATDGSGNSTVTEVTVIGGIDYRALPWPTIVAAILLLGALVGAARTGKVRVRERIVDVDPDEPFPEIEDLPSGSRW